MRLARVVGAGLSGLTAAWRLTEAGFTVEIIEAAERPGGLIETIGTPHGRVEGGANAFVWSQSVASLFPRSASRLNSRPRSQRRRYIFRDGRPRRWPLGFGETLTMALRGRRRRDRTIGAGRARKRPRVGRPGLGTSGDALADLPSAARHLCGAPRSSLPRPRSSEAMAASLLSRGRGSTIAAPSGGMSELMNRLVDGSGGSGSDVHVRHSPRVARSVDPDRRRDCRVRPRTSRRTLMRRASARRSRRCR